MLPPGQIDKLDDYLDYLLAQTLTWEDDGSLDLSWAGGLKEYKNKYSSLELQKLSLEWRAK